MNMQIPTVSGMTTYLHSLIVVLCSDTCQWLPTNLFQALDAPAVQATEESATKHMQTNKQQAPSDHLLAVYE